MKKLLKVPVFLALLMLAVPASAWWSFDSEFKCPEAEFRFVIGGGVGVCIPEGVYHCIFHALPAGPVAFGQGVVRGRSGLPGGCAMWCIEVCASLDLIFWSGSACHVFGTGDNCEKIEA